MRFTNYIALDLEWNQPPCGNMVKEKNGITLYGEIIQIGAVKMNSRFEIKDTFEINIKPTVYKNIAKRIEKITNISTAEANMGALQSEAILKFEKWCGGNFVFLTWGSDDIKILQDNLKFFGNDEKWVPERNFDLQLIFDFLTQKQGRQFSLDFAIEYYGIKEFGRRHNALSDAYYTALICGNMKPYKSFDNYRMVIAEKFLSSQPAQVEGDFIRKTEIMESINNLKTLKKVCAQRVVCPECNKRAALIKTYRQSDLKYALMYQCKKHGPFVSMLKMRPFENYRITKVVRSTYRPKSSENVKMGLVLKKWRAI